MQHVDRAAEVTFASLARLRRARVFHPRGRAFDATVAIANGDHPLSVLSGVHRAVVRLSRGAGLPEPLPDVLGTAIRILDVHGAGRHQDFLLATSGSVFPTRHLLVPAFGVRPHRYSSLLRYENADRSRFVVGAELTPGDTAFPLATASGDGHWQAVGEVRLGVPLLHAEGEALQFTPWRTGGGLIPIGLLNRLRMPAYVGSQRGRPDTGHPEVTGTGWMRARHGVHGLRDRR